MQETDAPSSLSQVQSSSVCPERNRAFNSKVSMFFATPVAANTPDSLKAELLHPDRQLLSGLRPEAVEYPEHFLGVEQPVPLGVFRHDKNSSVRHG
jgi:hypothetical protein